MAGFTHGLAVAQVEEERGVAFVRLFVVDHRSVGMMAVAGDQLAFAALAGVKVTDESLLSDAVRSMPVLGPVEVPMLFTGRAMTWSFVRHGKAVLTFAGALTKRELRERSQV